ncbi:hypothetical protein Hdeb2414_s0001g00002141 [Helianthus debilis subsp. tardiflorus]
MEPIKSNHHSNQYSPLDLAEIKSQPFKLLKKNCYCSSLGRFFTLSFSGGYLPHYLHKSPRSL